MKPTKLLRSFLLAAGSSLLAVSSASAQSGSWDEDANGTWSTPTNWLSDTIATGSGSTANFNNNITDNRTVSLDSDRTLTNVVFSDSDTATAGSWILNNNGVSTNNLILAGTTPTITVNALGTDKTATISAVIQGTVGLRKSGVGTLILSGDNTYSGNTTISDGTLQIGDGGAAGAATGSILNNGSLVINRTTAPTVGVISGTGSVTLTAGTGLALSGSNSFQGGFNYNGGTLATFGTGAFAGFGSGTLTIGSGAGGFIMNNTSPTVTLNNNIAWNQASSGFSRVAGGTPTVDFNGNVTLGQSTTLNITTGSHSFNFNFDGNIGQSASGFGLTLSGGNGGTSTLNGTNTFTGNLSAARGLTIGGSGSLNSGNYAGSLTVTSTGAFNYSSSANQTLSGNITSVTLTKNTSAASTLTLSGTNTVSGLTTVSTGTLQFARTVALSSSLATRLNVQSGATLALNVGGTGEFTTANVTMVLGNLAASSSATNGMNAGSNFGFDTTNASGGSFTIADVIANSTGAPFGGARGVTKLGTNTLVLTVANTYSGNTTISGGSLALSGSGSIANSPIIQINSSTSLNVTGVTGGSFTLGSGQTVGGTGSIIATGKTIVANGTLSPGNSPGAMTVDGGVLQLGVGGDTNMQVFNADGLAGVGYDTVNLINAATLDLSLLSAVNQYNINLWSLSGIGPDVSGFATNFDNTQDYSWTLFDTGTAIAGFDPGKFIIQLGAFNGTNGFTNPLGVGSFSVGLADSNTNLVVNFTAIPEPGAALLGSLGMLALLRRRRTA